jgi:hypothetical protein
MAGSLRRMALRAVAVIALVLVGLVGDNSTWEFIGE